MNGADWVFSENEIFWLKDKVQPFAWCLVFGSSGCGGGGGVKMLLLRCMRSRAEHGPRPHKSRAGVSEALGTQLVDQRECI